VLNNANKINIVSLLSCQNWYSSIAFEKQIKGNLAKKEKW